METSENNAIASTNTVSANMELYKNLYFSMEEGVVIFKMIQDPTHGNAPDFIIEDMNPAIGTHFNVNYKSVLGKSLRNILDNETIPFMDVCKRVLKSGITESFEDHSLNPNKYYKISIIPGSGDLFAVIFSDITKSKQHEEELRLSEEKYRLIVENANDGILISQNNEFIYNNARFAEMLGYRPNELKNISFKRIYTRDGIHDLLSRDLKRQKGMQIPNYYQTTFRKKDNSIIEVDVNYQIINYRNMDATFAIVRDITQQKQNQKDIKQALEKAKESDRLKSAFLANISHEIRTPMNGIMGFTHLLRKKDLNSEKYEEYLNVIERSSKRMLNLINDLMDISKIEANQVTIYNSPLNVDDLLNYLETFFLPECKAKNIKLKKVGKSNMIIFGDKDKLEAIFINLIKNSIKFTNKGQIVFGYEKKYNSLKFFVEDTGIGIEKEKHDKIFSRFVQADNRISKPYEGAGLGLAICRAYVDLMGGELKLISEPGNGSYFYFNLPLTQGDIPDGKNSSSISSQSKDPHNLNILIAEDNEPSFLFLNIIMETFAKKIIRAKNGEEALTLCKKNQDLDLILMDIKMPIMDGYEATKKIREFNQDIIIIAQTADAFNDDHQKIIKNGFNGHLTKPIQESEVKNMLLQLFSSHE